MSSKPSDAKRLGILGIAATLGGLLLCGCPGEAAIRDKGWREAIACVELRRSYKDCEDPPRTDAPYVAGWKPAVECMTRERNLAACREPQYAE